MNPDGSRKHKRPKRTPRVPNQGATRMQGDPALQERWSKTKEMLSLREHLMDTNANEVEQLLLEMSEHYDIEIHSRDARIKALEKQLKFSKETIEEQRGRLEAQRAVLEEQERTSKMRLEQLRNELDATRSELIGLAQSTKELVATHGRTKLKLIEKSKELRQAEEEVNAAKKNLRHERDNVARAASDAAFMRAQLDQNQRDQIELNARLHRVEHDNEHLETKLAQSARADSIAQERKVRQLQETMQQLYANNTRLLKIMEQIGHACGENGHGVDGVDLGHALKLFKFVQSVGASDEFRFVGDSALMSAAPYAMFGATERLSAMTPMLAQDLRTAVMEHTVIGKKPGLQRNSISNRHDKQQKAGWYNDPVEDGNRFVPKGASFVDPIVRLRTERDFWIPTPIVHFVSQFRARYFSNAPLDLFYTLLVEVSKLFREHSSISPSDTAVRNTQLRGKKRSASGGNEKRLGINDVAVTATDGNKRHEFEGAGLPSARRKANLSTKDVLHDYVALDAVRCVTGLRSLLSNLGSSGATTTAETTRETRDILTSSLRTVESLLCRVRRLETETTLTEDVCTGLHGGDINVQRRLVASVMDAVESAMERASVSILGGCGRCKAQLQEAMPMLQLMCSNKSSRQLTKNEDDAKTREASIEPSGRKLKQPASSESLLEALEVLRNAQDDCLDGVHGAMLGLRDAFSRERGRLGL